MKLPMAILVWRDKSKNGKQWMVRVTFSDGGKPFWRFYSTEREATELKRVFEKLALTVPVVEIRHRLQDAESARSAPVKTYPTLADAVAANLDRLERAGELRGATLSHYRAAQRRWVMPAVGGTPVDQVTRKLIGGVIERIKEAGLSMAVIDAVRHPIKATFERLIHEEALPPAFVNPGCELGEWIGKRRQKKQKREVDWFPVEVGIPLMKRCDDDYPRRYAFLATGMLAGLRWGESVALERDDIEWTRGTIFVQRTWSEKARAVGPLKDGDKRRVPLTKELRRALQNHIALIDGARYRGTVIPCVDERGRKSEKHALLMFPNRAHKLEASSGAFYDHFWTPLQRALKIEPAKKYHATRHTFATWALESGEAPLKVMQYLGHASLQQLLGTYYHCHVGNRGELGAMERMLELPANP